MAVERGRFPELVAKRTFHLRSARETPKYRAVTVIAWREVDGRVRLDIPCADEGNPAFREANPGAATLFSLIDAGMDALRVHEIMGLVRGERTHLYRGSIDPSLVEAAQDFVREVRERMASLDEPPSTKPVTAIGLDEIIPGCRNRLVQASIAGAVDAAATAVCETVLIPALQARIAELIGVLHESGDHFEIGSRRCRIAVGMEIMRILEDAGVTFRVANRWSKARYVETEVEAVRGDLVERFKVETFDDDPSPTLELVARWRSWHADGPRSLEQTSDDIRGWFARYGNEVVPEAEIEANALSSMSRLKEERIRLIGLLGEDAFERILAVAPEEETSDAVA